MKFIRRLVRYPPDETFPVCRFEKRWLASNSFALSLRFRRSEGVGAGSQRLSARATSDAIRLAAEGEKGACERRIIMHNSWPSLSYPSGSAIQLPAGYRWRSPRGFSRKRKLSIDPCDVLRAIEIVLCAKELFFLIILLFYSLSLCSFSFFFYAKKKCDCAVKEDANYFLHWIFAFCNINSHELVSYSSLSNLENSSSSSLIFNMVRAAQREEVIMGQFVEGKRKILAPACRATIWLSNF